METLQEAYDLARKNNGAPGIDGVTFEQIEAQGAETLLQQIQAELLSRTYCPLRVRKKEIPKEGGKVRVLSIPSIRDRVVQGALKLILEPILEAQSQPGSYGYRPRRTAHEAVHQVAEGIVQGKTIVIDWEWNVARYSVERRQLCEHACRPPEIRRKLNAMARRFTPLLCTEHPESPGRLREVWPTDWCRNFRQVRVQQPRARNSENVDERLVDWSSPVYKCYEGSRRIKLSDDRFVIVDTEDYEELSKHKWCASSKRGDMVYAMRRDEKGRTVYMHRQIVRARKGSTVDHKNCRIWDNRRCNLRGGTSRQNQMNKGLHGRSSGFVGVYPRGDQWEAGITSRGRHYYLGRFDDPIAAAKARDRKAYELHGEFAYLNFPEDYGR
jgi:hypothetical protein